MVLVRCRFWTGKKLGLTKNEECYQSLHLSLLIGLGSCKGPWSRLLFWWISDIFKDQESFKNVRCGLLTQQNDLILRLYISSFVSLYGGICHKICKHDLVISTKLCLCVGFIIP